MTVSLPPRRHSPAPATFSTALEDALAPLITALALLCLPLPPGLVLALVLYWQAMPPR